MLRILGRVTSINVRKALWAADELGLTYAREDWGLPLRDPNTPAFLALNPNAQVPVLVDGDFVLWESHAIMRYLNEKSGSPLSPPGIRARAVCDQWMDWQGSGLASVWTYAVMARVRKIPGYDDAAQIALALNRWTRHMHILDAQLAGAGPYLCGESFSLADIVLGLAAHRWFGGDFERPPLENVARYYDAVRRRPAAGPHFSPDTP